MSHNEELMIALSVRPAATPCWKSRIADLRELQQQLIESQAMVFLLLLGLYQSLQQGGVDWIYAF